MRFFRYAIRAGVAAIGLVIMVPELAAQTAGENQAKAILILAKAKREREELSKMLAAKAAEAAKLGQCFEDLDAAAALASGSERPLVIWVGIQCDGSPEAKGALAEMPDVVHCHQKNYRGDPTARLIFTDGAGKEWALDRKDLGKSEAIREIRSKLNLPALVRGSK